MVASAISSSAVAPRTQKVSEVINDFRPACCFRTESKDIAHVTSLDFDDSGELALTACNNETLQIYNCKEGKHAKELKSQKYGVHLARFTHHSQSIIYASTKVDNGIRYLSTHDNSYIRYFKGHTNTVTCLALNPSNDTFISCSEDNSVRLWALNSPNTQGMLKLHAPHLAAYDPSASVIAVASPPTHTILLYDVRNMDKAPFTTFDLRGYEEKYTPEFTDHSWAKLEFSNDGKRLVLGTTTSGHFALDAFNGSLEHFCGRHAGTSGRRAAGESATPGTVAGQGDTCLSPDGQFLMGGSGDNGLLVWDLHSPDHMLHPVRNTHWSSKAAVVAYNQRMNLICTADRDLTIWLPDLEVA